MKYFDGQKILVASCIFKTVYVTRKMFEYFYVVYEMYIYISSVVFFLTEYHSILINFF